MIVTMPRAARRNSCLSAGSSTEPSAHDEEVGHHLGGFVHLLQQLRARFARAAAGPPRSGRAVPRRRAWPGSGPRRPRSSRPLRPPSRIAGLGLHGIEQGAHGLGQLARLLRILESLQQPLELRTQLVVRAPPAPAPLPSSARSRPGNAGHGLSGAGPTACPISPSRISATPTASSRRLTAIAAPITRRLALRDAAAHVTPTKAGGWRGRRGRAAARSRQSAKTSLRVRLVEQQMVPLRVDAQRAAVAEPDREVVDGDARDGAVELAIQQQRRRQVASGVGGRPIGQLDQAIVGADAQLPQDQGIVGEAPRLLGVEPGPAATAQLQRQPGQGERAQPQREIVQLAERNAAAYSRARRGSGDRPRPPGRR